MAPLRRSSHICALAVALVVLLLPAPGHAASRKVPFGFLGVTAGALEAPDVNVEREMQVMAASGVETLRLPVYWWDLQPQEGGPLDFTEIDRLVAAAARSRIDVLPVVLGAPAWARRTPGDHASPPRDPADYAAFVQALVARYGARGSLWTEHPELPRAPIRAWQIWNEPDNTHYWRPQPFVTGYVALLRAARQAIRQADPGARVVLAGFATPKPNWPVLGRLYRAGARGLFDVVAIHPYTLKPSNVVRLVALARRQLRRFHDGRRPLWATEITWPASRGRANTAYGFEVDAARQRRNLAQVLPRLAAARRRLGLQRIYWETWISRYRDRANAFDFSGLRRLLGDGTVQARPAMTAFRTAARRLQGCAKTVVATRCRGS